MFEDDEFQDDDLDLGTDGDDESPSQDDPDDIAERLRNNGVDESLIDEVRKGYLRQKDYTKKTQNISGVLQNVQAIAAERDFLMKQLQGKASGGGDEPQTMLDEFLASDPSFEDTPELRTMLSKFGKTVVQEAMREMRGVIAPVAHTAREAEFERVLGTFHEKLSDKYDGLDKVWPKVKQHVKSQLDKGIVMDPEEALWIIAREKAAAMRARAAKRRNQETSLASMEGLSSTRRSIPQGRREITPGKRVDKLSTDSILDRVERRLGLRK